MRITAVVYAVPSYDHSDQSGSNCLGFRPGQLSYASPVFSYVGQEVMLYVNLPKYISYQCVTFKRTNSTLQHEVTIIRDIANIFSVI